MMRATASSAPTRALRGSRLDGALLPLTAIAIVLGPAYGVARAGAGAPDQVGAYCPLPEQGEAPVCLTPARAEYRDFFGALDQGQIDDAQASAVESDLRLGVETERAYLALSSLSYGYYRLAERVGQQADADPALLARLRHWNELLLNAYGKSGDDPRYRAALRAAAIDLHRRTPRIGETCSGADAERECVDTEGLIRTFAAIDQSAGLRSPLAEVIDRLLGDVPQGASLTRPVSGAR